MKRLIFIPSFILLFFALVIPVSAQWSDDPGVNLAVCQATGEQTLSKIGATSDGGCFISWQDHRDGNYEIYLQYFDQAGNPQLGDNGLLIDGHPQDTWITDYDMIVSSDDYAIIAINDIRAGGDWDIYAYKISMTGEFLWGDDGLTLSDNANFEPDPRIAEMTNGDFVFAWMEDTAGGAVIDVRRVTAEGADVWMPAIMVVSATYNLSIPRIVPSSDNGVILEYLKATGTNYWDPKHIYVQKINAEGGLDWDEDGVAISTAGGIGMQVKPDLAAIPGGGAVAYWYDARTNDHHAYAQLIQENGTVLWTTNGVQLSTVAGQMESSPGFAYNAELDQYYFSYRIMNTAQSMSGVGCQMLNGAGDTQWTGTGATPVPLSTESRFYVYPFAMETGSITVYFESVGNNEQQLLVKAFHLDDEGELDWDDPVHELNSTANNKGKLNAAQNSFGQIFAVWNDPRNDASGDIYAQNLNPDGTLGPWDPPQQDPTLVITSPSEGEIFAEMPVTVQFEVENFMIAETDGDGILQIRINADWEYEHYSNDDITLDSLFYGANQVVLELLDYDREPLDPAVADTVNIVYEYDAAPEQKNAKLSGYMLLPAYPNPFNSSTRIGFTLAEPSEVTVTLYNTLGQRVQMLTRQAYPAGTHQLGVDLRHLSAGTYLLRMEAGAFTDVQKLYLVK